MRLLAFLLLGTLIFGLAFPAAILIIALFAAMLIILMVIGVLRGGMFKVYTTRNYGGFGENGKDSPADNPEVIDADGYGSEDSCSDSIRHQAASDEEQEGEIIELPATALRKEYDKH
jgi:hypothetical protein